MLKGSNLNLLISAFMYANCKPLNAIGQREISIFEIYFEKLMLTPHLKWKKLLNNSSWDFEHVLDTMDDYWVGPDENFCPESTPTRLRCYHLSKKWWKSKFNATLSIKNLLLPLSSVVEIFLGCTILKIWMFFFH